MANNPHHGSTFASFLDEAGIREEVEVGAIKEIIADQFEIAMKEKGLTKGQMAQQMETSRSQLDRLLDPKNEGVTLGALRRAAHVVGRSLTIELR